MEVYLGWECLDQGAEREEVAGDWKRLRNEELNDLYASPNIILIII
jgi:hypothetical protein